MCTAMEITEERAAEITLRLWQIRNLLGVLVALAVVWSVVAILIWQR